MVDAMRMFTDDDRPTRQLYVVSSPSIAELLHWAAFLDQGDADSPLRRESVGALLGAAEHNTELLQSAWSCALRELGLGSMTRSAVDLVRAALDAAHEEIEKGAAQ